MERIVAPGSHKKFRHGIKQVGVSQNLLGNLRKERFCSFPHRHGDVSRKPETRDETRGRDKTSISCETSSNFDTFDKLSNRSACDKVPRLPRKTT